MESDIPKRSKCGVCQVEATLEEFFAHAGNCGGNRRIKAVTYYQCPCGETYPAEELADICLEGHR